MTPTNAIAASDRPLPYSHAAGGSPFPDGPGAVCYESFTLNTLSPGCLTRTFSRVMTGRKPTSRTATRSAFAVRSRSRRTISASLQFSAQNVLFFIAN